MTATTETFEITPTVSDLLLAAAFLIGQRGLNKGNFLADPADPDSPCCTDAAIRLAAGAPASELLMVPERNAWLVEEAEDLMADYAVRDGSRECIDQNYDLDVIETIAGWNDQDTNCADSVIEALREIAELAK